MKGKLKYKNLLELQGAAVTGDVSKFTVKSLCESGAKLFSKAQSEKKIGENESAYILFWKYVELCKVIQKHPEYIKDIKYYDGMYNLKKGFLTAIKTLEELTASLEAEYERSEVKPEVKVKAKRNLEDKENIKVDDNVVEKKKESITHMELHSLIQQKSTTFFILDTRPSQDYNKSRIKVPNSLNIPEEILSSGVTASAVGKKINIQDRDQWERRTKVDKLILLDWSSKEFIAGTPVNSLNAAITQWDSYQTYKSSPVLLEGGFEMFRLAFPHMVTDPKYKIPDRLKRDRNENLPNPDLNLVIFPDLDKGFLITPSPSPKSQSAFSSGAIKITRGENGIGGGGGGGSAVTYPSLDGFKATPSVDRRTKPLGPRTASVELDDTAASTAPKDDFNNARLSGLSRTDSTSSTITNSSTIATSSTSSLNNAMIGSTLGSEPSMADLSSSTVHPSSNVPAVNRSLKQNAEAVYSKAKSDLDLAGVLEVEGDLADLSLYRQKENLDKELQWVKLCQRREEEANVDLRSMLATEQETLVNEIEDLNRKGKEAEERENALHAQLEQLKLQLVTQKHETKNIEVEKKVRFKAEEDRILKRQVEEKRRERKRLEDQRRINEEERRRKDGVDRRRNEEERRRREEEERRRLVAVEKRKEEEEAYRRNQEQKHKERLKEDGSGGGGGGLRRSYSSPNIAKMLESPGRNLKQGFQVPVPKFDRLQKPSTIVKRDFAGVWGTTDQPGLTGLRNLGNTCYMNSILQCVSNTLPLVQYFVSDKYSEDINEHSSTRGQVAHEFAALLRSLWSNAYKSISPTDIKATVGRFKAEFSGRDQQDSHEFACKLLEWLHDDTNLIQNPSKMPEIDTTTISESEACKSFGQLLSLETNPL